MVSTKTRDFGRGGHVLVVVKWRAETWEERWQGDKDNDYGRREACDPILAVKATIKLRLLGSQGDEERRRRNVSQNPPSM